jgi:hypothetical protein
MTVSSSINKVEYAGNAATTVFAFPYLFYSNSDIKVYFDGVLQSSGYTVTGVGTGSGDITFSTAPANGVEIIILRTVPYIQNTDFTDFDGNPSTVTEKAFDLLTMQTQQLSELQSRIVSVGIGSGLSSTTLPDPLTTTSFLTATLAGGFQWASLGSISTSIDTLFTGLATDDLLTYNGTKWVNAPTITTAQIANNAVTFAKLDDDILAGATTATIADTDIIAFGDVSDANKTKRTTVQGILDLVPAGVLEKVSTTTFSGAATFDVALAAGYIYEIELINIISSVDGAGLFLRTSSNGGSSFDSAATDYAINLTRVPGTPSVIDSDSKIDTQINYDASTGLFVNADFTFYPQGSSLWFNGDFKGMFVTPPSSMQVYNGYFMRKSTSLVNAVRFYFDTGNITSGTAVVYRRAT